MSFVFVSGSPCLDFVGTLKWRRQVNEEQLSKPLDVSDWACAAGLTDAPISISQAQFKDAIALREAIYRVITNRLFHGELRRSDIKTVNRAAQHEHITRTLKADGTVSRRASAEQLFASIALDALDLLDTEPADRIRECDRFECTRLYIDNSRTSNRRWCGMSECGNNSKVAAFRERNRR